jgi:hypothetical protein
MHIGSIQAGDTLVCCHCEHERIVEAAWIETVCRRFFQDRMPAQIYDSDLGRFRCSSCQSKSLLKRNQAAALVSLSAAEPIAGHQLATAYLDQASREERAALLFWATQLLAIRDLNLPALEKAKRAIRLTIESGAIRPFVTFLGAEIKRIGWDERGLSERLALSAAAVAALMFSGQGAGIAALGGAIGVPLWVVFGAGGAFAGVLIDEAKRRLEKSDNEAKVQAPAKFIKRKPLDRDA